VKSNVQLACESFGGAQRVPMEPKEPQQAMMSFSLEPSSRNVLISTDIE
jgi:hypothetical protein